MRILYNRILIIFTLSLLSQNLCAQGSYSDFLNEDDIHRKAEMGLELWNEYLRSNQDSLKVIAVELLMDASEKEDEFARAVGTRILGSHLFRSGKIDQGLEYMISSREYFEKQEDYVTCSELYNEVGHALYLKGEYDEAIESYRTSIKLGKKSTDPTAEYNGEFGMGKAYIAKGDTNVGMNFIHNYKRLATQQRKYEASADALAYLAMIESAKGNENLSVEYYLRSLENSRKSKSKIHLSHSYANMGILKFGTGEMDSSLYYFEQSMDLRTELNNKKAMVEGLYNLGFFHVANGNQTKGIEYYIKSREIANMNGFISDEMDAITELIGIYESNEDSNNVTVLKEQLEELKIKLEEQKGVDEDVINSIDLEFEKKSKKKDNKDPGGIGWKELTIGLLVIGLIVLFLSERRRIS